MIGVPVSKKKKKEKGKNESDLCALLFIFTYNI